MREDEAPICISGDDDTAEPSKNGFVPKMVLFHQLDVSKFGFNPFFK
jgi:hypothetical protein